MSPAAPHARSASRQPRKRQPRRSQEETRALMLHAAVDLIRERAQASGDEVLADALAHVRLTQVARRATELVRAQTGDAQALAITTGAIYQQWPSQADFQADLLLHIARLQSTLVPGLPESIDRFRKAHDEQVPLEQVLISTMEEVHRHYREDPMYRVELSFLLGAMDDRLRTAMAVRQDAFYDSVDAAYQSLLDAYGRRIKPPFALRDLSRAIAAQIAGSVVTWYADPAILDDPYGEPGHSLMSRTIVGIFMLLTEPDPSLPG